MNHPAQPASAISQKTYLTDKLLRIGFIGLGTMGYPMAGHLKRAGHEVVVFNRSEQKSKQWVAEFGGSLVQNPCELAVQSEVIITCVGNDEDLQAITLGSEGLFQQMHPDSLFIDHTTTSAKLAVSLAKIARNKGIDFIDAPVSGGQAGAVDGKLTIMCGADSTAFQRAEKLLLAYAQAVTRIGPNGSGQLAKMVNQICIAGLIQGLAEGIHFGLQADLDMHLVLDVISKGAAQSWQMQARGKTMLENKFDFGFAVDWMRKDLGLVLDEARRNQAQLPVTALVDQFYAEVQALGGQRWDTSSLIKRLMH